MLKRLEMVGFKSFADKTAFDFPPGVTAIVGPNGSGKSNVVDAVRWVLGEQSARSLRGGEMTDVIFNGSASRRSLGLAEVTMTFDNTRRALATELDEVQITRRVYRGGEAEYLINGQIVRLKDVRDLFLGSGAGTDAYCIIEQGRVDTLLQSSTRERRTIFEEAAGISRFKARKIETLRRLERTEQNLARARDILDEIEKQLRSVRLQAAKAQQHQKHSERLRLLRVGLALREYHALDQQRAAAEEARERLRAELAEDSTQADSSEQELAALEAELAALEESLRAEEADLSEARQRIAAELARQDNAREQADALASEEQQLQVLLADAGARVAALAGSVEQARAEARAVAEQVAGQEATVGRLAGESRDIERRLDEVLAEVETAKEEHMEAMRACARLQNDAVGYQAQLEHLCRERGRLEQRREQVAGTLASLSTELDHLTGAETQWLQRLNRSRQALAERRAERDRLRGLAEETARALADRRADRSGVLSRIELLEDLERSHEGLGSGVREVFALLERPEPGPWATVCGLVADVLTVRRDFAPLIDLALGERAEYFLVESAELLAEALASREQPFSGRVTFFPVPEPPELGPLDETTALSRVPRPDLLGSLPHLPGLVARADRVVRCDEPGLAHLPAHLLDRTLLVEDLAAARLVARHLAGFRYVTLSGELLEDDGTVTVGTHRAEAGLLSRKSELRELRELLARLDAVLDELASDLAELRRQIDALEEQAEELDREIAVQTEQVADLRSRIIHQKEQRDALQSEVEVGHSELTGLAHEIAALETALAQAREACTEAEGQVQLLHQNIRAGDREVRDLEARQAVVRDELGDARVALAQVEERASSLAERCAEQEEALGQRQREADQARRSLARSRQRQLDNELALLAAGNALAEAHAAKEAAERVLGRHAATRAALRARQRDLSTRAQSSRSSWRARQAEAHGHDLTASDLRIRLQGLADRLAEDYALDLPGLYRRALAEQPEVLDTARPIVAPLEEHGDRPPEPAQEIEELKKKLARLGSVNLEAPAELAELEQRAAALQVQFDDLAAAEKALQDIIARINTDSRRLFQETFVTIRTHFQELFRKLFAGGQADLLLEDESDVLESGIEIIARPPGKELRSISLMSGGEKTMTAVALLLAIFRSKPSPFCILDEVDAALDEANVGRFTAVLRDYLDRSQFILITHSKRTMACADVLYGVTMQESGVSRRVGVRFEDWPDDERRAA